MLRKSLGLAQFAAVQTGHYRVQCLDMLSFLSVAQYFPTVLTHSPACESLVSGEDVIHQVGACGEVFQANSALGCDLGDRGVFVVGEVEVGTVGSEALEYSVTELAVDRGMLLF